MLAAGTFSRHLDLNAAVLHLAAISFQTDGTSLRDGKGGFEQFAVACTAGCRALDDHLDLIPVLGLVLLQLLVRASHQIVPTLKLWLPDENAAVGVDAGTEFELEDEVF